MVYLLPLLEPGACSVRPNGLLAYDDMVMYSLPVRNLLTAVMPFVFSSARGVYAVIPSLRARNLYCGRHLPVNCG